MTEYANVRVGLAVERERTRPGNVAGLELDTEFQRPLRPGNLLSSQARVFWGASQKHTLSMQNFNNLSVRLFEGLVAEVDVNVYLHRDNLVRRTAVKYEMQVGLGYVWDH